jgi:hypothetical protein
LTALQETRFIFLIPEIETRNASERHDAYHYSAIDRDNLTKMIRKPRFGMLYELQLPKPWDEGSEQRLVDNAIEQCVLGDKLGIDYAWSVEHHFLEEYSHCSASDVFLSAIAAKTERIKIGFGIRQVIPNYSHPARTAEAVAMLDLVSHGRAQFGIGEGATRLELGGFGIDAKRKRAMSLQSAREIADMIGNGALSRLSRSRLVNALSECLA